MRRVFVDTSALLPLLNRSDDAHQAVLQALRGLADAGAGMVTSSYTLVEAGALARSRLGMAAFRELGRVAVRAFEVVWVDEELHHRAWAAAAEEGRRGPSLVDQVGVLVMEDFGLDTALALDTHFARPGVALLPRS